MNEKQLEESINSAIKLKNSFGTRVFVLILELRTGNAYSPLKSEIDLTLRKSISILYDKYNKKCFKILTSAKRSFQMIENIMNTLLEYESIDREVIRVCHYNYEHSSVREVIDTLMAVENGYPLLSEENKKEVFPLLENLRNVFKEVIFSEDNVIDVRDYIFKSSQIEYIENLK